MKSYKRSEQVARDGVMLALLLLGLGLMGFACQVTEEVVDDVDSRITCGDYCDKKADCDGREETRDERQACVSACRDALEDECGNEHQAAANDQIAECVDEGCAAFAVCMVFEAAPECYGFVG